MKTLIKIAGAGLLVLSYVTASDARPHARRLIPAQAAADYYRSDDASGGLYINRVPNCSVWGHRIYPCE